MIKAIAADKLILGLSRKNIENLMEGSPILVKRTDIGISHEIFIFFGENEESMVKELKPLIGPETKVSENMEGE